MSEHRYQFGDFVIHQKRPEWGTGSVVKVEEAVVGGKPAQRLSIRFPNAGLKSLIAGSAELRKVEKAESVGANGHSNGSAHSGAAHANGSRLAEWERMNESDWLSPLAQRKIQETMTSIPEECTDAFNSLRKRLTLTAGLYRFDKSGRGLIDWAVAQSGLDDPLTRFTRQELEQLFDRWTSARDAHFAKLLQAAQDPEERALVKEVIAAAPPAARQAVKRLSAMR